MQRLGFARRLVARRPAFRLRELLWFALGLLLAAFIGMFVAAPLALTHRNTWPFETAFGRFAVSLASKVQSGSNHNPRTIDRFTLQQGLNSYTGSCGYCHGPTGNGKNGVLSPSLFPPATDLTKGDAKEKSDGELFGIIKHGLSFTAMPSFGDKYNDDATWAIVAYLRSLQGKAPAAATPVVVPTPSAEQLAVADHNGTRLSRGASIFFSNGCFRCHGGAGNSPGPLGYRNLGADAELICNIRFGPDGMPAFSAAKISDTDIQDLIVFLRSLTANAPTPGPRPAGTPIARPAGTPRPVIIPPTPFPPGATPPPLHYSGTANGDVPPCIPKPIGPPGAPGAPGAAGTPRPGATPGPRVATPVATPAR